MQSSLGWQSLCWLWVGLPQASAIVSATDRVRGSFMGSFYQGAVAGAESYHVTAGARQGAALREGQEREARSGSGTNDKGHR